MVDTQIIKNSAVLSYSTYEKRIHSTQKVPYSIYDCRLPEYFQNVPLHWHSEYEIDYVLEGTGQFVNGNEHFTARKGDIIITLPNMLHSAYLYDEGSMQYIAFVFSDRLLGFNDNDRSYSDCLGQISSGDAVPTLFYSSESSNYNKLVSALNIILEAASKNTARDDIRLKGALLDFFYYITEESNISEDDIGSRRQSDLIRPALTYMNKNYDKDISIDYLASLCSVSSSHFMNTFKSVAGISAIEYLSHIRLGAFVYALLSTDDDISLIAQRCGYNNISNFNRQFRRMYSCSPRDYRIKNKEKLKQE